MGSVAAFWGVVDSWRMLSPIDSWRMLFREATMETEIGNLNQAIVEMDGIRGERDSVLAFSLHVSLD